MNSFQKVIKYVAMGFAILLTVAIISVIVNTSIFVFNILSGNLFGSVKEDELMDFSETYSNVRGLDIDIDAGTLIIKEGTTFNVEAANVSSSFKASVNSNGILVIKENTSWNFVFNIFNWNNSNRRIKVILYLPKDFVAENVRINSGACNIDIETMQSDKLVIDAGAGNIKGRNMKIDELELDGGTGNIIFTNVRFEDIDIDCGVGNLQIEGEVYGRNKIDSGVGNTKLILSADIEDYDLNIDAGIGSIYLNGEKVKNVNRRGEFGKHSLDIDGGVGNITLEFFN